MSQKELQRVRVMENAAGGRLRAGGARFGHSGSSAENSRFLTGLFSPIRNDIPFYFFDTVFSCQIGHLQRLHVTSAAAILLAHL
jgi:hypothetical protein